MLIGSRGKMINASLIRYTLLGLILVCGAIFIPSSIGYTQSSTTMGEGSLSVYITPANQTVVHQCCAWGPAWLHAIVTGGDDNYQYYWYNATGTLIAQSNGASSLNQTIYVNPLLPGKYSYYVGVTDQSYGITKQVYSPYAYVNIAAGNSIASTSTSTTTVSTTSTTSSTTSSTTTMGVCTTCPSSFTEEVGYCVPVCPIGIACPQIAIACPQPITSTTTTIPTPSHRTSTSWIINISKGWNILPVFDINVSDVLSGCEANVPYPIVDNSTFIYVPGRRQYQHYTTLNASVDSYTGWFYSQRACTVRFNPGGPIKPMQFANGWNFFSIMPWMVNQSYSNIFSACNVQIVYGFSNNAWIGGENSVATYLGTNNTTSSEVGDSMIINVNGACQLQNSAASTAPPPLPS